MKSSIKKIKECSSLSQSLNNKININNEINNIGNKNKKKLRIRSDVDINKISSEYNNISPNLIKQLIENDSFYFSCTPKNNSINIINNLNNDKNNKKKNNKKRPLSFDNKNNYKNKKITLNNEKDNKIKDIIKNYEDNKKNEKFSKKDNEEPKKINKYENKKNIKYIKETDEYQELQKSKLILYNYIYLIL